MKTARTTRPTFRPRLEHLEDRAVPTFGFGWAFNFGGGPGTYCEGKGIATDSAGSVYAAGSYQGTVDFDPHQTNPASNHVLTATDATNGDCFVAKYLADGTFQWATDTGSGDGARKLAVRGSNVYVPMLSSGRVARLDAASGTMTWATTVASGGNAAQVAVDPAGNVDVSGTTASSQAFVAQLDPAGNLRWIRTASGGYAPGVAVDASGNVYATGSYTGTVTFGTKSLTSWNNSYSDAYVWKLDANGTTLWAGSMGSAGTDAGLGIAVDGGGNVLVTGAWGGYLDARTASKNNNFNPNSGSAVKLTSQGGYDIFIAKLAQGSNGALTLAWAKDIGGSGDDEASDMATDAAGNVYTTGYFNSPSVNFNPNGGTPYVLQRYSTVTNYPNDIFVSELTAGGIFAAAAHFGGPSANTGIDNIALDGSGNVYLTGRFNGTANFSPNGTYNLTPNGNDNAFISKLTQSSPLLAVGGAATRVTAVRLTDSQLQPIITAAIDRWAAAGLDPIHLDVLRHATVSIADLGGSYLGLADAAARSIRIDDDAAGHGWFVDPTPRDDAEFATPGDKRVSGRMDLLSVVAHELGHLVGLDDDHDKGHAADVMGDTLAAGARRLPTAADARSLAADVLQVPARRRGGRR
jgi:hypothetical protein